MARKEKKNYDGIFYVYVHKRATNGEVFYVGKGTRDRAWSRDSRNNYWHNVVNKNGYVVEIVSEYDNQEDSLRGEIALIEMYGIDNLVNMTHGGDGCLGFIPSEETRRKLSQARMGNTNRRGKPHPQSAIDAARNALKGKPISEDHKKRISDRMKIAWREGRKKPINEEGRRKISKANKGRVLSDEVKEKISEGKKGVKNPWYDPAIRVFSHKDGRVVECTKAEFRDLTGFFIGDITSVVNGRQKTVKGWSHLGVKNA